MDGKIQTRIPLDQHLKFNENCNQLGLSAAYVIRELINAFNDGDIAITKPKVTAGETNDD